MRPFNLEEYLKDPSRKVVTRDGRDARILCTNMADDTFPVLAAYCTKDRDGHCSEWLDAYTIDGRADKDITFEYDLFFADGSLPDIKPYDRVLTRGSEGLTCEAKLSSNFKELIDTIIEVFSKGDDLLSDIIPFDENKVGKIE